MKLIIKFILLLFPFGVAAQNQPPTLTLDSILSRILANNPSLEAYDLEEESYRHRADAATAWMAPMVGAGTFMTPYPFQKIMENRDRGNVMVQFEQNIPNAAKLRAKKNFILSQGDAVATGKQIEYNRIRSQAKMNYYAWLIAKNKKTILRQNARIMTTMRKVEEVRYPYNKSQLSGVYLIDARLEENENMIRMQDGIVGRSKNQLLALMNASPGEAFEIDSAVGSHFVPDVIRDTAEIAAARKDILRMDQNIRSMQFNIASMRSERKPDFRIRFDHMTPLSGMMPNAFSVMGMISVPIVPWASRMYKSEIKAMEYDIRGMEKRRESMLQETRGMLNGIQADIQAMHDRVTAMEEKIIPALSKAFEANYLMYQENKMPLQEVIDSWEALNMMHLNVLDEKLKHYEMIVEYEEQLYQ